MALLCKNLDVIGYKLIGYKSWLSYQQRWINRRLSSVAVCEKKFYSTETPSRLDSVGQTNSDVSSQSTKSSRSNKEVPFDTLLRQSSFIALGECEGKIISGTIIHTIDDDLYIDFGGKFHCVCKRPQNGIEYIRGAKVKLRMNDWELSARFLGSSKDMTLLEADCTLLGLISSPVEAPKKAIKS